MSDLPLEAAISDLQNLTACRCEPAWTERGLHETHCAADYRTDLDVVIAEVRRLRCVLVEAEQRAKRFQVLFDGGPETSCRTVWDDDGVECVSVPLADVRWAFGDSDA